jgi:biotin operon repressor
MYYIDEQKEKRRSKMPKKSTLLFTVKVLENLATEQTPLSQSKIADELDRMDHACNRKTVGRHIALLKEMGYPIVRTARGYYLRVHRFSKEEIKLVTNAIRETHDDSINTAELASRVKQVLDCAYVR